MGKRVVTQVFDDLTGAEIKEDEATTVFMTIQVGDEDPVSYELLFAPDSKATFDADMSKYTSNTDPLPSKPAKAPYTRTKADPENTAIRAWWGDLTSSQLKALALPEPPENPRGRIPDPVREAYAKREK